MVGHTEIKSSDYQSLLQKLLAFSGTLTATEQLAFAQVIRGEGARPEAGGGGFPDEAWHTFMGIISNNAGTISNR